MSERRLTLTIDELAHELHTSVRTIKYRLAAGAFPIPEVQGIDKKHLWSRAVVEEFVNRGGVVPGGLRAMRKGA